MQALTIRLCLGICCATCIEGLSGIGGTYGMDHTHVDFVQEALIQNLRQDKNWSWHSGEYNYSIFCSIIPLFPMFPL